MTTPSEIGALAELAVAAALTRTGRAVFLPFFSAHSRVDLVYEAEARELRRVQCKAGHVRGDVVRFYTCSHTGGVQKAYRDDVDDFGVYCIETNAVYIVPAADVPLRLAHLRLTPRATNRSAECVGRSRTCSVPRRSDYQLWGEGPSTSCSSGAPSRAAHCPG